MKLATSGGLGMLFGAKTGGISERGGVANGVNSNHDEGPFSTDKNRTIKECSMKNRLENALLSLSPRSDLYEI